MRRFDVDARATHSHRPVGEFDFARTEDLAPVLFCHACFDGDRRIDRDRFAEVDVHIHHSDIVARAPDRHADNFIQNGSRCSAVDMTTRSLLFERECYFGENAAVFTGIPGQIDAVRICVAADVTMSMWGDGGEGGDCHRNFSGAAILFISLCDFC